VSERILTQKNMLQKNASKPVCPGVPSVCCSLNRHERRVAVFGPMGLITILTSDATIV
jgi:hypothetical protein